MFIYVCRLLPSRSLGLQELTACGEKLSARSTSGPIDLLVTDGN